MGIFWNTILCYGFYVPKTVNITNLDKKWYIKDTKGYMIFIPRTMYDIKSIDQSIEEHETKQGFVLVDDAIKAFKLPPTYFDVTENEKKQLIELANKYNVDEHQINKWIVEYVYDTYSGTYDLYLSKKLLMK